MNRGGRLYPRCKRCNHAHSKHLGGGPCASVDPWGSACVCEVYVPKRSLTTTTRMAAKKKNPAKRRFAALRLPEYVAWIRTQPCVVVGVRTGQMYPVAGTQVIPVDGSQGRQDWRECVVEAAHIKSRGAGGADADNTVPLDRAMHREQHRIGIQSFQRKHGIDLKAIARALWIRFEKETGVPVL